MISYRITFKGTLKYETHLPPTKHNVVYNADSKAKAIKDVIRHYNILVLISCEEVKTLAKYPPRVDKKEFWKWCEYTRTIRHMPQNYCVTVIPDHGEYNSNAIIDGAMNRKMVINLIAAAPDMLNTLLEAKRVLDEIDNSKLLVSIDTAIEKATKGDILK